MKLDKKINTYKHTAFETHSHKQLHLLNLFHLNDFPRMSQGVDMVARVPDWEFENWFVDSLQIAIDDNSFSVYHTIDLHDFNFKLECWKGLLADVGLFKLSGIVEYELGVLWLLFLKLFF